MAIYNLKPGGTVCRVIGTTIGIELIRLATLVALTLKLFLRVRKQYIYLECLTQKTLGLIEGISNLSIRNFIKILNSLLRHSLFESSESQQHQKQ